MSTFDPHRPYNDLPPLPPSKDVETNVVLRHAIDAARALAELKGLGQTIPNQAMLVDSLVLQEAKASSEIENIVTTNDALFKAFTNLRQLESIGILRSQRVGREILYLNTGLYELLAN